HPKWKPLLLWLSEYGFDSSSLHVEACETTDGLRSAGLLERKDVNTATQDQPLSSTQIISLHLLLHRPTSTGGSRDPLFGPFIAILPESFDGHPLTWLLKQRRLSSETFVESDMLSKLPPFVSQDLERVSKGFLADWERHSATLLVKATNSRLLEEPLDPGLAFWDFLWGWLNVNTRCIHYRVRADQSHEDNLTLCPILDFANHSDLLPTTWPRAGKCELWNIAPRPGKGDNFVLLSPSTSMSREGDELFLRYGSHTNQFLFAEYGFVNPAPPASTSAGDGTYGSINISPDIEDLFHARGCVGRRMKAVLEDEGYWGSWTMHLAPGPAHPDYRLICALRLYATVPREADEPPTDEQLEEWRQTVYGVQESISAANESRWRQTLLGLCESLEKRARSSALGLAGHCNDHVPSWVRYSRACIAGLWKEEECVSRAVAQSIKEGVEF
ncbi:hypothetical protein BKA70DRAFT_1457475, partial [Coprinopsis sp. MPI-PUGE-AT-0042]